MAIAVALVAEIACAAAVLVLTPTATTGSDRLAARIHADIGPAIEAIEKFWDRPWNRDVGVVTTKDQPEFVVQAHLDPAGRWDDIAAVAVADDVDLASGRVGGGRVVFAPGASAMSDAALRVVVTHELFHLAARGATATDAPRWLTEGVADYVARPPAPVPPGMAGRGEFPADADLDGPGPARSAGYDRAWWFARFVAADFGDDGLLRLYHHACGPGHGSFADAVRPALGVDIGELRSRWARWLSR